MKKILTIVLLALLTFSFVSCGDDGPSVEGFTTAINNSDPDSIVVKIKSATALGELSGTYTVTYNEDGSFTIDYVYEKFNDIGEGEGLISKVPGKVTCDKNGNYSDGGELTGKTALVTGAKINLSKISGATISQDGNSLTATVKAANTKAVLGVELPSDAELLITKANDAIASYSIKYSNASGEVIVSCEYN